MPYGCTCTVLCTYIIQTLRIIIIITHAGIGIVMGVSFPTWGLYLLLSISVNGRMAV